MEFSIHHPRKKKKTQKPSSRDADTPECYASPTIQMMIEDADTQTQTIYLLFIFLKAKILKSSPDTDILDSISSMPLLVKRFYLWKKRASQSEAYALGIGQDRMISPAVYARTHASALV